MNHVMATDQLATDPSSTAGNSVASRRKLLTGVLGAAILAACSKTNQPRGGEQSSASASATASETKEQTPYEKYYENVPAELKTRIEALKAKTSAERQQLPWEDQTLYAISWALELEYRGKLPSSFVDTKTGNGNDSLAHHSPNRTPLDITSNGQDIWEQTCYFDALLPSMGTRETQRDLLPLVGAEGSPMYDFYAKTVIPNNEPGDWIAAQDEPTWKATKGDEYTVDVKGKQVRRCDLTVTIPSNGNRVTHIMEFTEMPLLDAVVTTSGSSTSANKRGIWTTVDDHK
jgi:hypothetical protein